MVNINSNSNNIVKEYVKIKSDAEFQESILPRDKNNHHWIFAWYVLRNEMDMSEPLFNLTLMK